MAKKKAHNKRKHQVKQSQQKATQPRRYEGLGVPSEQARRFMALYDAKRLDEAQQLGHMLTEKYADSAFAWKALGTSYLEDGKIQEALPFLEKADSLASNDSLTLTSLAAACFRLGEFERAVTYQKKAVELNPDYAMGRYNLAEMQQSSGELLEALKHAKKALELGFDEFRCSVLIGALQYQTKYFTDALKTYQYLEEKFPSHYAVYNNLGNLYKDIGDYAKAEQYYQKSLAHNPQHVTAYSNIFYAKHYNPYATQQEIIDFAKKWDSHFAFEHMEPAPNRKDPSKPLRVGLISSGFRLHPVGQMITSALENSRSDIHYYGYTINDQADFITQRIRNACKVWRPIRHLSQQAVAEQIRADNIDLLIDLSGHGDGNCLQAISMRPAPLCIKWVGGLVNTMGVESIDYLLSDHIETPDGVDDQYTEKLIRLPDDYICYVPCPYAPATTSLPVMKNGYITLGCLNNPAKVSAELLAEWAKLMHELPESRLLLRGPQYESEDFCNKIRHSLEEQGIESYRIQLEGPTKHKEFIATYQRIDIALDTWPYSGGLTTCEALLMGVPVVTLPGPTFAGRHSATHLINAGLQELVASSWDEYRQRVLELANDLPNLAVIRAGLRTILNYSPVCDAPRFANHFNNALRAIWVRYCDGKSPEALTFNKEGELWFEDDKQPLELPEARSEEEPENQELEWQLDEPITIIDNAAVLPRHPDYPKWMASGHLAVISFDPASLLNKKVEGLKAFGELHHYPHALLGDGQSATLYAALDVEKGSTLKPLPEAEQPEYLREKVKTLAELPISTVKLDDIEGISDVDMLVLDDLHDVMKVLENGQQTLKNTLLIQVKVAFQPTHECQPNLAELQHWSARNGFRLYRLNTPQHLSHLPDSVPAEKRQATELVSTDAIFVPDHERTASLTKKQRTKLAFLLHTVYDIKDMAYELLAQADKDKAERYLVEKGRLELSASKSRENKEATRSFEYGASIEAKTVCQETNTPSKSSATLKKSESTQQKTNEHVADGFSVTKKIESLWELDAPISVVDIGANPIDGAPPYAGLLKRGLVKLVGFEPQKEALQKLLKMKGANEIYLPYAVGSGERALLYICQASGMTSTLKPNNLVLDHFQGYPIWGKVKSIEEIDTVRLDDIEEIEKVDWLKIDIQGGELNVFKNGEEKLKNALVIQTEVNFIQLYEDQPLFAEIDQWMRAHGFMLHTLLEQRRRLYAPMKVNGGIHQGINQLTTADAVYVRDINCLGSQSFDNIKKIAFILHEAYGSFDLSLRIIRQFVDDSIDSIYLSRVNKKLPLKIKSGSGFFALKHLFVFGCGHTGTTLMATILGESKDIYSVKRETEWFLRDDNVEYEIFVEEEQARASGSRWLCEKTPRHIYCYEEIVDKFNEAKFVVMTREAKDVVASIKNRTGDFSSALDRWLHDSEKSLEVSANENAILVRYEDFIRNPEEKLREICNFLGVDFSLEMLGYHESKNFWFGVNPKDTDGKGEKAHLERRAWQMQQPIQDRRGIWKNILSDKESQIVDEKSAVLMKKLGY